MTLEIDKKISEYQQAYYNGTPLISDQEYDALVMFYKESAIGPAGEVKHVKQMYSLQKVYPKRGEGLPKYLYGLHLEKSPKYDGNAIELVYLDGTLVSAVTRGDGITGVDVTAKVHLIQIPHHIPAKGLVQVVGEVTATKPIDNARNVVSGALVTLQDMQEVARRFKDTEVAFIAYGVSPYLTETYSKDMLTLDSWGFDVAHLAPYADTAPQDGVVYRVDSNKQFDELGYTSSFPRGADAEKQDEPPVITTLVDVVWQVGPSGKVTPVAILEPIQIDGANISRATLNNQTYIQTLGLEIGCKVALIRAGGVIPKIVARAD